jgi:hypothetical protein
MQFSNPQRELALHAWRGDPAPHQRASADNVTFEECISPARWQRFEAIAPDTPSPAALARWQTDYCATYVQTDNPDSFRDDLDPARLVPGSLDTHQRIARLERVPAVVLNEAGLSFEDLRRAFHARDAAVLDAVLQLWNARRDGRPAFAAWKDELIDDLRVLDWADRVRDRLGLAHHNPDPARPIPVILMEYDVASVLRAAASQGTRHAFVCPTVVDSPPWPWFFPSPAGLAYGRTMNIGTGSPILAAEFLHVRMTYTRDHIARLGEITRPVAPEDLRGLRNRHLAALRTAARRPDFGEDMP